MNAEQLESTAVLEVGGHEGVRRALTFLFWIWRTLYLFIDGSSLPLLSIRNHLH